MLTVSGPISPSMYRHIAVLRVFGAGAGPQRPLRLRPFGLERGSVLAGSPDLLEAGIGQLCVGNSSFA